MEKYLSPDDALAELKTGNDVFVQSFAQAEQRSYLQHVSRDQVVLASILSCADARTAPEHLFSQGLGDIFVIRVAGNVATEIEQASLEYSAVVLKCPLIVVMGHSECGAVRTALDACNGKTFPGQIQALASLIAPAATQTRDWPGDWLENATRENVRMSVQSLSTSSVLSPLADAGRLKIVGAYYELASGKVTLL